MKLERTHIAALSLSAAGLVGIATYESYTPEAVIPVKEDVPTVGFGTTGGVKLGDTTTPTRALQRLLKDENAYEQAVKKCVKVPLYQHEYDAYMDLTYNIGPHAFCTSTLVKYLNQQDYKAACKEILKWNKFHGRTLVGLTIRRQEEYKTCMGEK